jgi:hypothetical protein
MLSSYYAGKGRCLPDERMLVTRHNLLLFGGLKATPQHSCRWMKSFITFLLTDRRRWMKSFKTFLLTGRRRWMKIFITFLLMNEKRFESDLIELM